MSSVELTQKEIALVHDIVVENDTILSQCSPEQVFEFIARLMGRIQEDRLMEEILVYQEKKDG